MGAVGDRRQAISHSLLPRRSRATSLCADSAIGGQSTRDAHYRHPYQYCDFSLVSKYEQLAASTMSVSAASSRKEAEKAFRRIDADGSGELDMNEMVPSPSTGFHSLHQRQSIHCIRGRGRVVLNAKPFWLTVVIRGRSDQSI